MMPVLDNRVFDIDGWMSHPELSWLYETAMKLPQEALVVEAGAWLGRSTAALYTGAPSDACVVTVDTWKGQLDLVDTDHRLAKDANLLDMFLQNMASFGITPIPYQPPPSTGRYYYTGESVEAAALFQDSSVNFCFIDADHNRVGEDIQAWLPKMASNGILCGHDYSSAFNQITLAVQVLGQIDTIDSIWYKVINRS